MLLNAHIKATHFHMFAVFSVLNDIVRLPVYRETEEILTDTMCQSASNPIKYDFTKVTSYIRNEFSGS